MAWYDPTSWDWSTDADRENQNRAKKLDEQAASASGFSANAADRFNNGETAQLYQQIKALQDLASGKNSVSAEQLRQGLMQNLAAQRSMAASASPANGAMAARNAAMNMGRLGYGLSGQQAIAGLQERNQAQQALGQLALGMRGQDLQGFLGANSNALAGYGAQMPQSAAFQMTMGGLGGLSSAAASYLGKGG